MNDELLNMYLHEFDVDMDIDKDRDARHGYTCTVEKSRMNTTDTRYCSGLEHAPTWTERTVSFSVADQDTHSICPLVPDPALE
jgi:hypothetical protein